MVSVEGRKKRGDEKVQENADRRAECSLILENRSKVSPGRQANQSGDDRPAAFGHVTYHVMNMSCAILVSYGVHR